MANDVRSISLILANLSFYIRDPIFKSECSVDIILKPFSMVSFASLQRLNTHLFKITPVSVAFSNNAHESDNTEPKQIYCGEVSFYFFL